MRNKYKIINLNLKNNIIIYNKCSFLLIGIWPNNEF